MATIDRKQYTSFLAAIWLDINAIKNYDLFVQSLTHKSYAADFSADIPHNERLEFAWDAILGSIIATLLFINHPNKSEADMTLYKIALVREEMLAHVAKNIGIDAIVLISNEKKNHRGERRMLYYPIRLKHL
jgi:ribonuclease-3